jgi:hypothetical protein
MYRKDRIFAKNLLENKEMDFNTEVMNIQTVGYNGARTVVILRGQGVRIEEIMNCRSKLVTNDTQFSVRIQSVIHVMCEVNNKNLF